MENNEWSKGFNAGLLTGMFIGVFAFAVGAIARLATLPH